MKKWIPLCAILLLLSAEACAEPYNLGDFRLVVLDDPFRIDFEKGSSDLTKDGIEKAIVTAAPTAGWRPVRTEGRLELQNLVQNKHLMILEATIDATGYGLRYVRSENLLYREQVRNGTPARAIHKNYDVWVRQLVTAINSGVDAPARIAVGYAPIQNADAVPFLKARGREAYGAFLNTPFPRAFAIAPNGAWGRAGEHRSSARADEAAFALDACNRYGNGECKLYAIDDHVVWRADERAAGPEAARR